MSDTIIKAESLCFTYEDGTEALKELTLKSDAGEKSLFLVPTVRESLHFFSA